MVCRLIGLDYDPAGPTYQRLGSRIFANEDSAVMHVIEKVPDDKRLTFKSIAKTDRS